MRGTHHLQDGDPPRTRIIPADAGNTIYGLEPEDDHTDHPRGCGEHGGVDLQTVETDGSSPRMRGTHWFGPPA